MSAYKFTSSEPPYSVDGFHVYSTRIKRDYYNAIALYRDILWRIVEIDGRKYRVVDIDKHPTSGTYYEGSEIALAVEYVH